MEDVNKLRELARLVRYYILYMTTKAGSGHATSALSATDIMTCLFFNHLKFDISNPKNLANDRVIFSKGHASPLLYALWTVAGVIGEGELDNYRQFGSKLEGHPTPRFEYVDAATGSLGQGLSVGVGMAIGLRAKFQISPMVYVLLGDSEMAEGSVWEAMEIASFYKLNNIIAMVDVNRLGQSRETMLGWNLDKYKARAEAFGWRVIEIDGHDFGQIGQAFGKRGAGDKPLMILAATIKGKGVSFLENKEGWHGKALPADDFKKALTELGKVDKKARATILAPKAQEPFKYKEGPVILPKYKIGEEIATRKAYGEAIAAIGATNSRVVCLDGETSNSTYSEIFREKVSERYFEMFIAEQNMVGVALGLSKLGFVPFASTFSVFFSRAYDQIRMSAVSRANIKFVGSHAGVSIGEDGPSQMALEDIAMFRSVFGSTVVCPSDANSCAKLVREIVDCKGVVFLRTQRPATSVIYADSEEFKVGGSKILRESDSDKIAVIACGVCVIEALKAAEELKKEGIIVRVVDAYSIKPIDEKGLRQAARESGNKIITCEDHYLEGGLGDAVLNVFANDAKVQVYKLAVSKMPMSGKGGELLAYEEIDSVAIVNKVKEVLG